MDYSGKQLRFITEKIEQIKFAIFKSDINSELLLPNSIIQVLQTDDEGHIWFLTSCNEHHAVNINRSFYAYLDFYKKGANCRLQLNGQAIIDDEEKDSFIKISNYSNNVSAGLVLIKMKILQADYQDGLLREPVSLTTKFMHTIHQILFDSEPRVIHFR